MGILKNLKQINGFIAEQKVALEAISNGYTVCIPTFQNGRYDLILEKNGITHKVQVKSTSKLNSDNRLSVKVTGGNNIKYSKKEVDYYIVLTPNTEYYIIPRSEVAGKSIRLYPSGRGSFEKFKNNWKL